MITTDALIQAVRESMFLGFCFGVGAGLLISLAWSRLHKETEEMQAVAHQPFKDINPYYKKKSPLADCNN